MGEAGGAHPPFEEWAGILLQPVEYRAELQEVAEEHSSLGSPATQAEVGLTESRERHLRTNRHPASTARSTASIASAAASAEILGGVGRRPCTTRA